MVDDPKTSGLYNDCHPHDLDNLDVVDASFFTSSAAVNPTLPIAANALRVADRLQYSTPHSSSDYMTLPHTSNPHKTIWPIATLAAIVFAIIWNFATNISPPTGVSIGELSNTVFAAVRIIPANYAFAIWGLIYTGLVAFGIYQLDSRRTDNISLQKTRPWLVLVSVLQCTWILLFLYQQMLLSTLVMLGILWGLVKCYLSLHSPTKNTRPLSTNWVPAVFSVYLGWISVATIVNIAATLYLWGWNGTPLSSDLWTVLLVAASVGLALVLSAIYADRVFGGTIVWSIVGIIFANLDSPLIGVASLAAIAILSVSLLPRSISL